ncbi:glycine--tRNA ligase subunit beta [Aurantiacibacter gangjinensis]|uniref:Glycine--tRNA ligase beta subunit n=1 Tax=Aurantiacibacter gangjinensis TaxID=502682 RepID=A0A0G9MQN4_9SPHN|nr:glycine--tRNA ligase subunit beta [Aurantiacibacter gangjinensis]APE28723.1 Glycyl-tRNA synthetase beta chain [Aurantiacibacter gangjinensis]KLE32884.1 glycyl-tRNA synthetase subunit beta [Aurantiacibacter gangjinensis]
MSDFLLELRSEEIPARMQAGARAELEKLFRREMDAAGVAVGDITVWSTPRRLALIARGLPDATEAVSEEAKGPPVGAPDQAVDGFCRKMGVDRGDLETRDVKGRATYFAVKNVPGRRIDNIVHGVIQTIVHQMPWPKSMRWGGDSIYSQSLSWVRPLSGIVALVGDRKVNGSIDLLPGIAGGAKLDISNTTRGHRFHHSGDITIGNAADYAMKLRAAHVIVDHEERAAIIRDGAAKAATDAGLSLVEDEGLVVENAGLTEWPVPLLGRFEEDFLDVPAEVIQLTARVNQKYFVCEDSAGKLANAFICTANIEAEDGGSAIVDGNRKVLAARLADARFFWEQDRKKTLADHAEGLARITFHEKLGTVADKVERVAKLARWLVEEGIVKGAAPEETEQAARLAKADLVTEMVGEFPELQGLMGGYYARAEGLPGEVADAIRDHYKPVGQGDEVPTAPVTVAVSLADKLDTLVSFFAIDEKPTGSKDPFALRRAALSIIRLLEANSLRISLISAHVELVEASPFLSEEKSSPSTGSGRAEREGLLDFFADRLKVQQREAGVRHDLIDAVFALGGEDDLVRLLARVHALQSFMETENGTNLLAGYKRASNILKKENYLVTPAQAGVQLDSRLRGNDEVMSTGDEDPMENVDDPQMREIYAAQLAARELSYTPELAEKALIDALDAAEPKAAAAVEAEDFAAAMAALASLRAPIDAFFDEVTVNDDNPDKRAARLDLLARFRAAVHGVADFSKIEG